MSKQIDKPTTIRGISLRSYAIFSRPYRLKLIWSITIFSLSSTFLALMPVYIGKLVGTLSHQPIDHHAAWVGAVVLVTLSVLHNVTWRIGEFSYRAFILPMSFLYETQLFKAVVAKPYPYFVDKFTGKISAYITTLSDEFRKLLDELCFNYSSSFVSLVSVLVILASVNWQTAAVYGICLLGMLLAGRKILQKNAALKKIETDKNATKNGILIDAIGNFASIKAFRTEMRELQLITNEQTKTFVAAKRALLWEIVFWATMSVFVRDLMWPIVILMNVAFILNGQISVADFTTVISTALIFTTTIWDVIWYISQFNLKIAKTDEAYGYLFGQELRSVLDNAPRSSKITRSFSHEFAIQHLSFAYPDQPTVAVLQDISITIKQGERIGIVGKSGSGKSTLTKLLLDHYETSRDAFYFDGKPVPAETVAKHVAFVPQDTTLFHRSIRDNIAYAANKGVDDALLLRTAQQANAHEFIAKLEQGYDTIVGERGVKLSGGQRQRIAIARAILKDAPILVLDEATSALDSESELLIQQALEKLWQGKTVIAIAHRLSTLRKMDRIIVMNDGRIAESGTHQELLDLGGTYATLWAHQSGGFIEE